MSDHIFARPADLLQLCDQAWRGLAYRLISNDSHALLGWCYFFWFSSWASLPTNPRICSILENGSRRQMVAPLGIIDRFILKSPPRLRLKICGSPTKRHMREALFFLFCLPFCHHLLDSCYSCRLKGQYC